MTIGRRNLVRLRKDKGWNTVEFVVTIRLNSMDENFFLIIDISERYNSAFPDKLAST